VVATCKYLTTHQLYRRASAVEVSASFIGIVFSQFTTELVMLVTAETYVRTFYVRLV